MTYRPIDGPHRTAVRPERVMGVSGNRVEIGAFVPCRHRKPSTSVGIICVTILHCSASEIGAGRGSNDRRYGRLARVGRATFCAPDLMTPVGSRGYATRDV